MFKLGRRHGFNICLQEYEKCFRRGSKGKLLKKRRRRKRKVNIFQRGQKKLLKIGRRQRVIGIVMDLTFACRSMRSV